MLGTESGLHVSGRARRRARRARARARARSRARASKKRPRVPRLRRGGRQHVGDVVEAERRHEVLEHVVRASARGRARRSPLDARHSSAATREHRRRSEMRVADGGHRATVSIVSGNNVALWATPSRRMLVSLPRSTRYLVIGAGIHGLSTAYHLAKELRTRRSSARAATSSWSTRPGPAPAHRASPAASSATTTSSRRWPS